VTRHPAPALDDVAGDPVLLAERVRRHGLHLGPEELELAQARLGRTPRWGELVCLDVLWSEHCSYRSTRHLLRRLPSATPQVLVGPGQDAGVVTLGEHAGRRYAAVLGHESHNHPSQVVPYEGAATGVGGIVRDVACMGARVVGVLDALRFGTGARRGGAEVRGIVREVVRGVGEYGNALGVPNLGGDVWFDPAFDGNCLVNVVAVGVVPADEIVPSAAPPGQDSALLVVGKPTDDSGFGGASFASTVLGEEESARRGAVQLPDPFLLRALTLANEDLLALARREGWRIGGKDLGAGGVACATVELAHAGGLGAEVQLEWLHRVAEALPPWVLLCAETQERYCWAVPWEKREAACAVFERQHRLGEIYPGAGARVVGRTRADGVFRVTWGEEVVVECPAAVLTAGIQSPRATRRRTRPKARARHARPGLPPAQAARALLTHLSLASRAYLYEKYDSDVQGLTVVRRGEAAAGVVAPVAGAPWGLAMSVAGNPAHGAHDPYLAAAHAVCEAARRVVSVGAVPWALTDCLNFGSALSPEVMGDFEAAVEGLAAAAAALGTPGEDAPLPFVSGNVSLYNQDEKGFAIPPSPIVACLGRVPDLSRLVTPGLKAARSVLLYVGGPRGDLAGSACAHVLLGEPVGSGIPPLDLEGERKRLGAVRGWIEEGQVLACQSLGLGGVGRALFGMAAASPGRLGAIVEWPPPLVGDGDRWSAWWSEEPGFLLEVEPRRAPGLLARAAAEGVRAVPIGQVRPEWRLVDRWPGESGFALELTDLVPLWRGRLSEVWRLEESPLVEVTA
jgi:phosphoribosylformylglycinamidine synthase